MMWSLNFISEEDFQEHVYKTILKYGEKLKPFDLIKFNRNIIDPIKLIFDKMVYNFTWEEIIKNEIFRQKDKSNNNDIGYFHQGIFAYMKNCEVPKVGWDIILSSDEGIEINKQINVNNIYVEMKNKHNTMNSSSSAKTYIKMQNQILLDDNSACILVEVIAKKSQNIPWSVKLDDKNVSHRLIRRMSIDEFYYLVTGEEDAFYKVCLELPNTIKKVLSMSDLVTADDDTVFYELTESIKNSDNKIDDSSIVLSIYMLGFSTYNGFN